MNLTGENSWGMYANRMAGEPNGYGGEPRTDPARKPIKKSDNMIAESIPRTRAETLGQIKAIEEEFATYAGTDYYKSNRADLLRQRVIVLDRLLNLLKD